MTNASRRKGQEGEREFLRLLREYDPHAPLRKLDSPRDGGDDVEYRGLSIEVKRHRTLKLTSWYKQALAQGSEVIAFRADRQEWEVLVRMDINEFQRFAAWREWGEQTGVYE